jgi:hypothetical protein
VIPSKTTGLKNGRHDGTAERRAGEAVFRIFASRIAFRPIICCKIDCFLDLSDLRHELAPFYRGTGRPSVDPELMIRMLVVGYCSASALSASCARKSLAGSRRLGRREQGRAEVHLQVRPSSAVDRRT